MGMRTIETVNMHFGVAQNSLKLGSVRAFLGKEK